MGYLIMAKTYRNLTYFIFNFQSKVISSFSLLSDRALWIIGLRYDSEIFFTKIEFFEWKHYISHKNYECDFNYISSMPVGLLFWAFRLEIVQFVSFVIGTYISLGTTK